MKKTYITPEMEIVRISMMNIIATSTVEVTEDITDQNKNQVEFNSNSFRGGVLWEED